MYSRNHCRSLFTDYILLGALLRRMLTNAVVSAAVVSNCHVINIKGILPVYAFKTKVKLTRLRADQVFWMKTFVLKLHACYIRH